MKIHLRIGLISSGVFLALQTGALGGEQIRSAATTSATQNVINKIKEPFERETGLKIVPVIDPSKSDVVDAFKALMQGNADFSTSSNPLSEVLGMVKKKGLTPAMTNQVAQRLIARDIMNVFSHSRNGVGKMTVEQVAQVFSGKIRNWKELGGADLSVKVVVQADKLGTVNVFKKSVLGKADFVEGFVSVKGHEAALKFVNETPGAIGFGPHGTRSANSTIVEVTPALGRPVFLFTLGKPSPAVEKMAEFIRVHGPEYGVGH